MVKKSLIAILTILCGLLTGLLVAGWLLFMTTEGSRWLISQVADYAQGSFKVARIEGRLGDRLHLYDLEFAFDGGRLHFDSLLFDWLPEKLLRREVTVRQLVVGTATCHLEPVDGETESSPEAAGSAWPKLPEWLAAWRFGVERVNVEALHVLEDS